VSAPALPAVAREQHALELDVRARRLPPLRPSPVPTLVTCHYADIVLETAVRPPGGPVLSAGAGAPPMP